MRLAVLDGPGGQSPPARTAAGDLGQRGRQGGRDRLRRAARAGLEGPLSVVRAAICREYGPPEVVEVGDFPLPAARSRPGTGAGRSRQRQLPRRAVRRRTSTRSRCRRRSCPAASSPVSCSKRPTTSALSRSATASSARSSSARSPRRSCSTPPHSPRSRTASTPASAAAFGVAHRTAYHVLRSVAALQPGEQLVVLGAGGGVGLAAVQLGVQLGATSRPSRRPPKSSTSQAKTARRRLIDHRTQDLRQALKEALPQGGDVVIDPVGGDLAEPALRCLHYGGRFVTVGYASGVIPRIPLNLVLLKGMQVLGFQFIDFATHRADELAPQRSRTARAARRRPGGAAHRRPLPARRRGRGAALRGRRQGHRQGPARHRLAAACTDATSRARSASSCSGRSGPSNRPLARPLYLSMSSGPSSSYRPDDEQRVEQLVRDQGCAARPSARPGSPRAADRRARAIPYSSRVLR